MKIGVQLKLLPGETVRDQAQWAQDHGVEGIELGVWGGGLPKMRRDADEINGRVTICSVCGNTDLEHKASFEFLDPELARRRASIDGSKAILEFCGEVGAVGQIVPPIFGPPKVPDLAPWKSPLEIEEELMIAACREIGPFAAEHRTHFMLEPLNRYEQHYLRKQSDGMRVMDAAREVFVSTMAVVYNVEDRDEDKQSVSVRDQMRAEVNSATGAPRFTPLAAIALMVFYVLAMQCVSTMAIVAKETGSWRWAAFQWGYMLILAWVGATLVYQVGRALGWG